ncbi:MAG: ornithine cyclodeaminase family protein [Thaumarchaeota archaeon]|nr:ornithine cyclodeaminase family protein [Nitrososphaerota archaeon]
MTLILSDPDIAQLYNMSSCVEACEEAYRELAFERAPTYTRRDLIFPTEQADTVYRFVTMEGGIQSMGVVAQRIDSEKVAWRSEGGVLKQLEVPITPSGHYVGIIYLYSVETGELLAIMNDGEIGRMRVAATCGVAAKYMARADSENLGLFGAGWQAGAQIPAIAAIRGIKRVRVYSPTSSKQRAFCEQMRQKTGLDVVPVDEPREAVRDTDIVAVATSSRQPVVKGDWMEKGQHAGCIVQSELDEAAWRRAEIAVISHLQKGEVRASGDTEKFSPVHNLQPYENIKERMGTLPSLLKGDFKGRENDQQITMFVKTTGLGIEFAATAKAVYDEAMKKGLGREIPTDWFTQVSHT